jgi:hypothetical protein
MARRRRNKIGKQFHARIIEMMESPAYRVLSLTARRVLDRICIELAHHGGNDHDKLPVVYENFIEYGCGDRNGIAAANRTIQAQLFPGKTIGSQPAPASRTTDGTLASLECVLKCRHP